MNDLYTDNEQSGGEDVTDIAKDFLKTQEGDGVAQEVIYEKKIYTAESMRKLVVASLGVCVGISLLFYVLVIYTGLVYIPRVTPDTDGYTDQEKQQIFNNL